MADFQQITISGRLTREPEMNYTPNGNAVTKISVASGRWNGKSEDTTFYNVAVWGKAGETINKWADKGTAVIVSGSPNVRIYSKKDGTMGVSHDIDFASVTIVSGMKKKEQIQQEDAEHEAYLAEVKGSVF